MGTALESTEDRDEREAIHKMIHEVERTGSTERKELDIAIREVIKRVIFQGQEMAPIRNTVKAAIAREIKAEVLDKYIRWRDEDKQDPKKWPFK
jgi:hypothetical protein